MKVEQAKQIASSAIGQLRQSLQAGHSGVRKDYLAPIIRRAANEMLDSGAAIFQGSRFGTVEGRIGLLGHHLRWRVLYNQHAVPVGA